MSGRALLAGVALAAMALATGCSTSQERLDTARTDYISVVDIANDLTHTAQTLDPTLALNYAPIDDTWHVCTQNNLNAPPTAIDWQAMRGLEASHTGTTELIEAMIEDYLADGWTRNPAEFNPLLDTEQALLKDGLKIHITGTLPSDTDDAASHLTIWVFSTCTTPPDNLDTFDPKHPEDFFPDTILPTQPPDTRPTLAGWGVR